MPQWRPAQTHQFATCSTYEDQTESSAAYDVCRLLTGESRCTRIVATVRRSAVFCWWCCWSKELLDDDVQTGPDDIEDFAVIG